MSDVSRWVEVTASPFPHEAEGLAHIRSIMPSASPFRAWSNVEFRDGAGKWSEVDLLLLGRRRLHLIELKYYAGVLRGDDLTWRREGKPAEDSPLKLARRKAQRLKSRLLDEAEALARETGRAVREIKDAIPYVQESVYLHHPTFRSALRAAAQQDLFGLPGEQGRSGLPGIDERVLESAQHGQLVDARAEEIVVALLTRIGLVQRRQREVGSWIIDDEPLADGDGFQDWPAHHRVATTDRRRIRFFLTAPGAATEAVTNTRRLAEHEYRILGRLQHEGLLRPLDLVEHELGVGLVFPYDERYTRLDLWAAQHGPSLTIETKLQVVRQLAETLGFAHRNRVVHRGLQPAAVQVREVEGQGVRVLLGDWQSAGMVATTSGTALPGVTALAGTEAAERLANLMGRKDQEALIAQAFQAPESRTNAPDRVRLDVFALGAVTYYLLAGRPPAADRITLRERLRRDGGLDLAADVPAIPSALRDLVLAATRPTVGERLADIRKFLEGLDDVQRAMVGDHDVVDPLDAEAGSVLDGRFEVLRRLGKGSTAVGLLVRASGAEQDTVLKCALDDAAARRLDDEAAVLATLDHPRLVRLLEGPIEVGDRRALQLSSAGDQTLGEALHARGGRLSLDRLQRWGDDLLEAMAVLDRAGVMHRDVKPGNLGVLENRGDRQKHLVLFDFSLARASADALTAGTAPYLDPFLGERGRERYDSAAERYAAAVVLFEMATGQQPSYGDAQSDPAVTSAEVSLDPGMFDPTLAGTLLPFFADALARDADRRHHTVGDMQTAWQAVFRRVDTTVPDDGDESAAAALPSTPLTQTGLSPRALSALEPLHLVTAADLAAVDPMRLGRLAGVGVGTRQELTTRAKQWRLRFGAVQPDDEEASPTARSVDRLMAAASDDGARMIAAVVGRSGAVDAFASVAQLAATTGLKRNRIATALEGVRNLDELTIARAALDQAADVLSVPQAIRVVETTLGGEQPPTPPDHRLAEGIVALAVDDHWQRRRRDGRVVLLARDPELLDAAAAAADALDADLDAGGAGTVLARGRVESVVRGAGLTAEGVDGVAVAVDGSRWGALSGRGEVHHRALPLSTAIRIALEGLTPTAPLTPTEIRERVRARFPMVEPAPGRPRLDELLAAADLPLLFDEQAGAYRPRALPTDTSDIRSRTATVVVSPEDARVLVGGELSVRLAESARTRSFLALTVTAARHDRAIEALQARFDADLLDMTRVLLDVVAGAAATAGVPWQTVLAADAAAAGTRESQGLARLVENSLPDIIAVMDEALAGAGQAGRPLVLVELGPLARYGHLGVLSRWTDLAAPRPSAVWALLPQLGANQGAVVDGRPMPLAAPGQLLRLDAEWVVAATSALGVGG